MKHLAILGSTGSIGRNALSIVEKMPEHFSVKALAGANNVELLAKQIDRYHPEAVAVLNAERAGELAKLLSGPKSPEIGYGESGYRQTATLGSVDMVISAMVGAAGLMPTLAAIDAGKQIALANKETLVMAGDIVMNRARRNQVDILPIDSEHSAIFQCVAGHRMEDVDKIFLTASGGPFLNRPVDAFDRIRPDDALDHPTWQMGQKISIDSATLMNKGLEIVEATHLFGVSQDVIEVLIHPQSVVHSMVSFNDGTVLAQLGIPDMTGAIAYAMSYPDRLPIRQPVPDFPEIGTLSFEQPDYGKFPCLSLACQASSAGGTLPSVLNASNEVVVDAFLNQRLSFNGIPQTIQQVMERHAVISDPDLPDILDADRWARAEAEGIIRRMGV